ncbi:MAG: hypothetical protein AUJ92_01275 [Armatimonadetes bacterium CG2_30_59_28]|nr:hypothetical protein [Armatimonadota bacterium]OIO98466.1 MAG: hypothetical protein AUJ92_01275 [Armatimonadetes bacterium CG2_30_59_28]PIU64394.1 MAG: hypothetical protein COS85_12680 [Armatimonadetes bacterium CG07_land_8_20_14_0_80_59_28]PIY43731.1 MAG: hypothetical protein COZ05_10215 [Armatimonadetes bacterium CG_4_10_14_3_um_filter_59_10]
MKKTLSVLVAALFIFGSVAAAQPRPPYPCYRLAAPPVIDGKLDDTVWQSLPEAKGFRTLKAEGFAHRKPTSFRIGWANDALFLAVRCKEPFSRLMMPLTGDLEPLWDDDSIEVFLTPTGADYFQFIANTAGARWNGRKAEASETVWNWTAKAQISGDD